MAIFKSTNKNKGSLYLRISYILVALLFTIAPITPAYAAPSFTVHASPACNNISVVLDGDFWCGTTTVTRMDTSGSLVASYDIRTLTSQPTLSVAGIAAGMDGNLWFSGLVGTTVKVGLLNISTGIVTLTNAGVSNYNGQLSAPVTDSDGNIWFYARVTGGTVRREVVRVNTSTGISAVQFTSDSYSIYSHISSAGDGGGIWFTDTYYKRLEYRKVSPAGALTNQGYALPGDITDIQASAPGPNGTFWFISNNRLFKLTISDGNFTEYPLPSGTAPRKIITGTDGAVWFTDAGTVKKIHRITLSGTATEYTAPSGVTQVSSLILGPDNAIWFHGGGTALGRLEVTPDFSSNSASYAPQIFTKDNLWTHTATNVIRIDASGATIADYNIQGLAGQTGLSIAGITLGSDGNVWFTGVVNKTARAGRIDISTGKITLFYGPVTILAAQQVSKPSADAHGNIWYYAQTPYGMYVKRQLIRIDVNRGTSTVELTSDTSSVFSAITVGRDDKVWIADTYYKRFIAKSTTSETLHAFPSGVNSVENLTTGADGNIWFSANSSVFRLTPTGTFTEFALASGTVPQHLVGAIDGTLWFADNGTTKQISHLFTDGSLTYQPVSPSISQLQGLALEASGTIRFSASTSSGPIVGRFGY